MTTEEMLRFRLRKAEEYIESLESKIKEQSIKLRRIESEKSWRDNPDRMGK